MKRYLRRLLFIFSLATLVMILGTKIANAGGPEGDCWLVCNPGPNECYLACDFGPCTHGSNWLQCNGYRFYCPC